MSSPHKKEKSIGEVELDIDSLVHKSRILNIGDIKRSEQEVTRPSKVKGRKHVYYPPAFEHEKKPESGGKWMLFAFGDMDKLDYRWNELKRLCHEGIVTGIKSSTAQDLEVGITMCYTPDCEDIETVKKAADEIRNLIEYEYVMYYKTNEASADGQYRKYFTKSINMYMHLVKGQLYLKDKLNRWQYLMS